MEKYYPMRFAHRGLCRHGVENTIEAFKAAVEYGCEGIELDIRLSKDGIPMVVHDGNLNRLSDGVQPGNICDLTAEEIKKTDIPFAGHLLPYNPPVPYSESLGSVAQYTDEELARFRAEDKRITHVMTFAEFDKWFAAVEEDIIVEIEFCSPGLMKPMYEILSKSENCDRYILFSGHDDINDEIQSLLREKGKPEGLRLGANVRRLNEHTMEFIKSADLYEVGLNDFKFTADDVKWLEDRNIKVFSNLGDYPEWWTAISELRVEAFKTNYAEAYTDWKNQQK